VIPAVPRDVVSQSTTHPEGSDVPTRAEIDPPAILSYLAGACTVGSVSIDPEKKVER